MSRHCHHQNDPCIKTGSNKSRFIVSLIVRDKVARQCPQTTTLLKRKESWRGMKPRPFLLTSHPNALPLGQTAPLVRLPSRDTMTMNRCPRCWTAAASPWWWCCHAACSSPATPGRILSGWWWAWWGWEVWLPQMSCQGGTMMTQEVSTLLASVSCKRELNWKKRVTGLVDRNGMKNVSTADLCLVSHPVC